MYLVLFNFDFGLSSYKKMDNSPRKICKISDWRIPDLYIIKYCSHLIKILLPHHSIANKIGSGRTSEDIFFIFAERTFIDVNFHA